MALTPDSIQSLSSPSNARSDARNAGSDKSGNDGSPGAIREGCERRFAWLYTDRESWRQHYEDLADFILPRRGRLFVYPNQGARGSKVGHKILDSTATKAARTLASGMLSGLTSPSRPWFVLGVEDPDLSDHGPVRAWLDLVRLRMLTVFAKSNVYNVMHSLYEEQGVFGTGVMLVDEDKTDVIRAYGMQVGQYMLGNSSRLEVDLLYRDFTLNVTQLVEQFGFENCSLAVQAQFRAGQFGMEREVVHAIEPNLGHVKGMRGNLPPGWSTGFVKSYPYRSVYYERGGETDKLLAQSGYHERPFMCPRWSVYGNDAYGRSPGMDCLADVRGLQVMQRRMAEGVAKLVDPPVKAPIQMQSDGVAINALPGGLTYVTAETNGKLEPLYQVNFRPESLAPLIQDARTLIKETFFADLFLMISQMDGQPPTAEEIRERQNEKMLQLGPVVERNMGELLDPLIERTFSVMLRRGLVPPPPREIHGQRLDVDYISVLAQAQRATNTTSIERFVAFVGSLSASRPDALNKLDVNEAIDQYADALLVPSKVVVDSDTALATTAKQHAQAAQQQAMQQSLAAVQGAQTLSQTDVGGGQNALASILGNGPSPAAGQGARP